MWCVAVMTNNVEQEGWALYAAEQERHAETTARLDLMTREARMSREATEKAVQRLESLRNEIARLHDVYAVAPNEPRCCSDCAALDISDELRMVLRNSVVLCSCGKPAAHTSAPEDSTEWACRVPNFDPQTGRILGA